MFAARNKSQIHGFSYFSLFSFEDLNIPYSEDCASGFVEIGPVPKTKLCGSLNTSSPTVYISQRNHAWIKFCSVGWDPGRGFSLRYMIGKYIEDGLKVQIYKWFWTIWWIYLREVLPKLLTTPLMKTPINVENYGKQFRQDLLKVNSSNIKLVEMVICSFTID